jgi:hypothetical protein
MKRSFSSLLSLAFILFTALLSLSANAHPGHGFGELGHDAQHALWNFLGMVVICAVVVSIASKNRGH